MAVCIATNEHTKRVGRGREVDGRNRERGLQKEGEGEQERTMLNLDCKQPQVSPKVHQPVWNS